MGRLAFLLRYSIIIPFLVSGQTLAVRADSPPSASAANWQSREEWDWQRLRNPSTGMIPPDIRNREIRFARRMPRGKALLDGAVWDRRGPFNLGGRTRGLVVDATDENILIAGGVSGGMWRSQSFGGAWSRVSGLLDVQGITALIQDPRPGQTGNWYSGSGEIFGNSARDLGGATPYRGDGISVSRDGGFTWAPLPSTRSGTPVRLNPFDYVNALALDPSNTAGDELYAATFGGVWRSGDGGANWNLELGVPDPATSNAAVFSEVRVASDGTVYAALSEGFDRGIWRSRNGTDWEDITPPGWPERVGRTVIAIAPRDERIVYCFTHAPGGGLHEAALFRLTGETWTDLTRNLPSFGGTGNVNVQSGYNMSLALHPRDSRTVFLGDINLWRSTDGFESTANLTKIGGYHPSHNALAYPGHHPDVHVITFLPSDPSVMLTASDGGVHVTRDCLAANVAWESLNNGYYTTQFFSVAIDHAASSPLVVGGVMDLGTQVTISENPLDPWKELLPGDGGFGAVADGGGFFYSSAQRGDIFYCTLTPSGDLRSWSHLKPEGGENFRFITPFVMDPEDNRRIYVGAGTTVWRNSDVTGVPPEVYAPTSINYSAVFTTSGGHVSALGISREPPGMLYVGTHDGGLFRLDGAGAGSPPAADIGTGKGLPRGAYTHCIAVDPHDGNRAVAVFSNYGVRSIFHTFDGGNTWRSISGSLEEQPDGGGDGPSVRWVSILSFPRSGSRVYFAGTSTGLYSARVLNGDDTVWTREGLESIGETIVASVDSRDTDGLVIAGTHGNGAFSAHVSSSSPDSLPEVLALERNYPNPFRETSVIGFALPEFSRVRLAVYDILGQRVATLLDGNRPAGYYSLEWNGRDRRNERVSSGVYFYRLEALGATRTRRMLLVR